MGATVTRAQLLAEARGWIGTPLIWQQSRKGVGCDCKGLVAGVARQLDLDEAKTFAARVRNYKPGFKPDDLVAGLDEVLIRTEYPGPGDVVALRMGLPLAAGPRHLAFLSDRPDWVIHCYGKGIDKVVEAPLGGTRKVWGYWTWPSLAGERGLG